MAENSVIVAHNAAFDLRFLPFLADRPAICSMRFAMRVIPDAPNYQNQVLRYHLGVNAGLSAQPAAHRALGDALITSRILAVCLDRYLASGGADDIDALVREIRSPRSLGSLPFGRHRGIGIAEVPSDYLRWVCAESRSASLDARYTAQRELERRANTYRLSSRSTE